MCSARSVCCCSSVCSAREGGLSSGLVKLALLIAVGVGAVRQEGYAARYAKGVMGEVADHRGLAWAPCMGALTSAHEITGQQWEWVLGRRTRVLRRCKVVDRPRERAGDLRFGRRSAAAVSGSCVGGARVVVFSFSKRLWGSSNKAIPVGQVVRARRISSPARLRRLRSRSRIGFLN